MSWIITGTQKLDPDAAVYIDRVEAADGQSLEEGVKLAYSTFVSGCKTDEIWDAIKASCILAGARTLDGALVPLVGTAPTNNNFVSADYDRETGLVGNGSTKYLNSNRAARSIRNNHISTYVAALNNGIFWGNPGVPRHDGRISTARNQYSGGGGGTWHQNPTFPGLLGLSRSATNVLNARANGVSGLASHPTVSQGSDEPIGIFISGLSTYSTDRLAFYSIGESLDLALLDTRVTTLMSDLAAAIP